MTISELLPAVTQPKVHPERDSVQIVGSVFAWISALVCLIPLPLVVTVATSQTWQQGFWAGGFTLEWLKAGWTTISPYAFFSLRLAAIVLLLDFLIGLPTTWLIAKYKFRGVKFFAALTNVPIAIPGIAMGLALILTFPMLRSNGVLLVSGHILYTLPYFISAIISPLSNPALIELEAVAATLGANVFQRLIFVVLPKIRTALLAATIMVVTLSLGEFNVAFFLFTPDKKPLPVELYNTYITGRIEVAAAITLCFLCIVIPASILLERFGGAKAGQA